MERRVRTFEPTVSTAVATVTNVPRSSYQCALKLDQLGRVPIDSDSRCQTLGKPVEIHGFARPLALCHAFAIPRVAPQRLRQEGIQFGADAEPTLRSCKVCVESSHGPYPHVEAETLADAPVIGHQFACQSFLPENGKVIRQGKLPHRRAQLLMVVGAIRIQVAFGAAWRYQQSKRAERAGAEGLVQQMVQRASLVECHSSALYPAALASPPCECIQGKGYANKIKLLHRFNTQ